MSYGYRFPAEFVNKTSAEIYFTWSAGQALVYNAKVEEACYHYRFAQVFGGKMPNADQKYSHLITNPYTKEALSGVARVGSSSSVANRCGSILQGRKTS